MYICPFPEYLQGFQQEYLYEQYLGFISMQYHIHNAYYISKRLFFFTIKSIILQRLNVFVVRLLLSFKYSKASTKKPAEPTAPS